VERRRAKSTTTPQSTGARRWDRHPVLARMVRGIALFGPFAVALAVSVGTIELLPRPRGALVVVWCLAVAGIALAFLRPMQRFSLRLFALAALLDMTLRFPSKPAFRPQVLLGSARIHELERQAQRSTLGNGSAARHVALAVATALRAFDERTMGDAPFVGLADVALVAIGIAAIIVSMALGAPITGPRVLPPAGHAALPAPSPETVPAGGVNPTLPARPTTPTPSIALSNGRAAVAPFREPGNQPPTRLPLIPPETPPATPPAAPTAPPVAAPTPPQPRPTPPEFSIARLSPGNDVAGARCDPHLRAAAVDDHGTPPSVSDTHHDDASQSATNHDAGTPPATGTTARPDMPLDASESGATPGVATTG
jgi:hypothetical protein